ncbi:cysteine proteinase [Coprinopsis marcescibilis]|uniref:Cysteine proteinase n=1 Tax=Coprinopsis marcescibilis TaxID=230819 RepID=A0A5C3KW43_COPMA|nr:cysteine proteinase [Coprinopsis marcescibilis]
MNPNFAPQPQQQGHTYYTPFDADAHASAGNQYRNLRSSNNDDGNPASSTRIRTVGYAQQQLGASVAEGRKKAYAECKRMVEGIAARCRRKNRRFRDLEFDIENDKSRCLNSLMETGLFSPVDSRRVSELFEKPVVFYSGGRAAAEIVQGAVENCYLVSAMSGLTSIPKLVDQLCVARDEEVGVYGFIFHRDCYWIPVVIDDLLFTRIPRYEQLTTKEKELYHFEKQRYDALARNGGSDALYFAKAGKTRETWVPLVEKAYAKAHGDYASIMYGRTCDALEDMTGFLVCVVESWTACSHGLVASHSGVSSLVLTKDILDVDNFWTDELLKANTDRLFGCWFKALDGSRNTVKNVSVDGLVGNLSHSVVKAVECRGKRFVVLRDPWGAAGWDGPWSDGSKEWTPEWLGILPLLGHDFSGNGQFVMEYGDFLNLWQEVQRTLVFDDAWVLSSQWLHLPERPPLSPWAYGDASFSFSLPAASPTIIVLARADTRFFKDLQGASVYNLDFILVRHGEAEPLAESSYSFFYTRSVSVEVDLEPGNYVVHARLDCAETRAKDWFANGLRSGWDRRKVARVLTERTKSLAIASNYTPDATFAVKGVTEFLADDASTCDKSSIDAIHIYSRDSNPSGRLSVTTTTTTKTVVSRSEVESSPAHIYTNPPPPPPPQGIHQMNFADRACQQVPFYRPSEPGWVADTPENGHPAEAFRAGSPKPVNNFQAPPLVSSTGTAVPPPPRPPPTPPYSPSPNSKPTGLDDMNGVVIGLKVYTHKIAPTVITGRLRAKQDRR